jgi:hypothetical protein
VISAIVKQIEEAYFAAAASGEEKPSFGLGAADAAKFKSMPSIVFVPMREKIEPPKKRGDGSGAVALRHVTCMARIWGKDIDHCEDLAARLVEATRDALTGHGISFGDGEWFTAGEMQRGQIFAMEFVFDIELARRPETTAPIDSTPITAEIDQLEIGA